MVFFIADKISRKMKTTYYPYVDGILNQHYLLTNLTTGTSISSSDIPPCWKVLR